MRLTRTTARRFYRHCPMSPARARPNLCRQPTSRSTPNLPIQRQLRPCPCRPNPWPRAGRQPRPQPNRTLISRKPPLCRFPEAHLSRDLMLARALPRPSRPLNPPFLPFVTLGMIRRVCPYLRSSRGSPGLQPTGAGRPRTAGQRHRRSAKRHRRALISMGNSPHPPTAAPALKHSPSPVLWQTMPDLKLGPKRALFQTLLDLKFNPNRTLWQTALGPKLSRKRVRSRQRRALRRNRARVPSPCPQVARAPRLSPTRSRPQIRERFRRSRA